MSKQKKSYARGQRIAEAYGAEPYKYKKRYKPLRLKKSLGYVGLMAAKVPTNLYSSVWDDLEKEVPRPPMTHEEFKHLYLCSPEVQLHNELILQKELHKTEVKCTVSKSGEINFH